MKKRAENEPIAVERGLTSSVGLPEEVAREIAAEVNKKSR